MVFTGLRLLLSFYETLVICSEVYHTFTPGCETDLVLRASLMLSTLRKGCFRGHSQLHQFVQALVDGVRTVLEVINASQICLAIVSDAVVAAVLRLLAGRRRVIDCRHGQSLHYRSLLRREQSEDRVGCSPLLRDEVS